MPKPKGKVSKKAKKSKFVTKYVVQKKDDVQTYRLFDSEASLSLFKKTMVFLSGNENDYKILEISNQEEMDAFDACVAVSGVKEEGNDDRSSSAKSAKENVGAGVSGGMTLRSQAGGKVSSPTPSVASSHISSPPRVSFTSGSNSFSPSMTAVTPSVAGSPLNSVAFSPGISVGSSISAASSNFVGGSVGKDKPVSDNLEGYMSAFLKKSSYNNSIYWDISFVSVKDDLCVAVFDFIKSRSNVTETHWAHKPDVHNTCVKVFQEKIEDSSDNTRADRHEKLPFLSLKIPECLLRMGVCNLRATPGDKANLPRKVSGTSFDITKVVWYCFCRVSGGDDGFKSMIRDIVGFFNDDAYQQCYFACMKNVVKNSSLQKDCQPSSGYWHDISSSVNDVVISQKKFLSEIFMDEQIHEIMSTAFQISADASFARSMYTPEMNAIAYGSG